MMTRPPAVAGTFYPARDTARESLVDSLLAERPPVDQRSALAALVPHAGLRYSGGVAAEVWRRIALPTNVLILGPKHTRDGAPWAVAPHRSWQVSEAASLQGADDLAAEIADQVPGMELDAAAHHREHCVEVQLPLLHRLAPQTRLASIVMGGGSVEQLTVAAAALAAWLQTLHDPPLLVISSDLNHFSDDAETRRRDRLALDAFKTEDATTLLDVCREERISMCGRLPAALVLLTLQALGKSTAYEEVAYATSAEVNGDASRVVGYAGVVV